MKLSNRPQTQDVTPTHTEKLRLIARSRIAAIAARAMVVLLPPPPPPLTVPAAVVSVAVVGVRIELDEEQAVLFEGGASASPADTGSNTAALVVVVVVMVQQQLSAGATWLCWRYHHGPLTAAFAPSPSRLAFRLLANFSGGHR
uniref:Uncharacterized protein n=1 Tax=Anopheles farauti TaxID=69004 RepID=A0A182QS59_9DIPT